MLITIITLLLVILFIYLWLSQIRVKEIALAACAAFCEKNQLQLLDDTVSLKRTRVIWQNGKFKISRSYQFDYCEIGDIRMQGHVTLQGYQVAFMPSVIKKKSGNAEVIDFKQYQARNDKFKH